MQCFKEIWDRACLRKGGQDELEALMPAVENAKKLRAIADDRWLSNMTKRIFQAGFVWKVIENKWDDFEEAFWGFDPGRVALMSDEDLDRLVSDTRIIRNGQKISAVQTNASFICDLAREHGSAAAFFASAASLAAALAASDTSPTSSSMISATACAASEAASAAC